MISKAFLPLLSARMQSWNHHPWHVSKNGTMRLGSLGGFDPFVVSRLGRMQISLLTISRSRLFQFEEASSLSIFILYPYLQSPLTDLKSKNTRHVWRLRCRNCLQTKFSKIRNEKSYCQTFVADIEPQRSVLYDHFRAVGIHFGSEGTLFFTLPTNVQISVWVKCHFKPLLERQFGLLN